MALRVGQKYSKALFSTILIPIISNSVIDQRPSQIPQMNIADFCNEMVSSHTAWLPTVYNEAGIDLVLIQPFLLYGVIILFSCELLFFNYNFHKKRKEVCIKTRSTSASRSLKGKDTKFTTSKWSIQYFFLVETLSVTVIFLFFFSCFFFFFSAAPWFKMNNESVCFGAKNDSFGSFNVLHYGTILTFKLVYKSGYVTCNSKNLPYGSHWACNNQERIGTIITNAENKVIFPHNYKNTSFTLPSYNCNSSRLIYHLSPQMVDGGEEFRIWYQEDYRNHKENDNAGSTCTDVYALYN